MLASSDIMEKNRNSLACLKNAGSYSAESHYMFECIRLLIFTFTSFQPGVNVDRDRLIVLL